MTSRYRRVALLGGAGFLGRHLAQRLTREPNAPEVRVADARRERPPELAPAVEFIGGCDATDPAQVHVAIRECDAVVNLIGLISYWRRDAGRLATINAGAAATIARACVALGVGRLVHVSSSAALGFRDDAARPIDETFEFDWTHPLAKPYMVSKRDGEAAIALAEREGVSTAVANPAAMYGPGDTVNTARLFVAVRRGAVRVVPPGGNALADVRDVARGLQLLLDSPHRAQRFLFVGHNLSFLDIITAVGRAVGRPAAPRVLPAWSRRPLCGGLRLVERFLPREGMVAPDDLEMGFVYRYASARKAAELLGWTPQYAFADTARDQARDLHARGLLEGAAAVA